MADKSVFEDHCWKDVISEEDYATYAPYRRETYIGERPAVLAIDLYNLVFKGGPKPPSEITAKFPSTCGQYAYEAVEPIQNLLAGCRAANLPIFYITGRFSENRVRSTRRNVAPLTKEDYEIHEAFTPEPDDVVFRKERASAFFGTPLIAHLTQGSFDSLIVCGESTSGCVRTSVLDAYSYGFHISIVEECVFDRSELIHKVNLFDMHHKYADVMKLNEVLAHLAGLTETKGVA
ncbi:MAG: isochorismatase family protein [Rhodospirillaceae bacterium]